MLAIKIVRLAVIAFNTNAFTPFKRRLFYYKIENNFKLFSIIINIMEMETMFKNAGEPWTPEEERQLNKLYNEDMLDIMEISKIHCRAPGGILSRLKLLKYITHRQLARGYDLYKKSNFYNQAIQINKENYKKNLTEKLDNTLISICKNDYIELQHDVKEMKNDNKDLKNSIKELVEMMKAAYDFEDV